MHDHSTHIELPRQKAIDEILGKVSFSSRVEEIAIDKASGRVLATDLVSLVTLPNVRSCRLDSIAVHFDDFEGGIPDTSDWVRGVDWEFANTGVALPGDFDTAIVVEHVRFSEDMRRVRILAAPSRRFAGTSPVGSTVRAGEALIPANTVMTPLLCAHAASGGHARVPVISRPRVLFIPTGTELVPVTSNVPKGGNIDSNSILIGNMIREFGGEAILHDIVPDDPHLLEQVFREAASQADIVIVNAGSSKGSDDHTMEILESIGLVICHETDHGPGHHSSFSIVEGTPFVGISGPPAGAAFTTDFYVRPLIRRYLGLDTRTSKVVARLADDIPAHPGSEPPTGECRPREIRQSSFFKIMHVKLSQAEDGVIEAHPYPKRPAIVDLDATQAYYALDTSESATPPKAGDLITVELRNRWI